MNQRHSQNIFLVSADVSLMVRHATQDKIGTYPSIWACKCDKDFEMSEYLKDCTCVKSLFDYIIVTCDKIGDTQ